MENLSIKEKVRYGGAPASTLTGEDLVASARALVPRLRELAAETDANRAVSQEIYDEMARSGFFHLLKPRKYQGLELSDYDHSRVAMTLAEGCASTAWVFSILSAHNRAILLFSEQAQDEVWGDDSYATMAGATNLNLKATAERVDGGYLLTGQWGFCSGSDFAEWFTFFAPVGEDGAAHRFLLPREDVRAIDDWYPTGMRGTGSRTIAADRVFVPDHRIHPLAGGDERLARARELYPTFDALQGTWPFRGHFPFASVAVGAALGAVAHFEREVAGMTRVAGAFGGSLQLIDQDYVATEFAEAAAEARMASYLLDRLSRESAERAKTRTETTSEQAIELDLAAAAAVRTSLRAAQRVFMLAGAKASRPSHPVSIAKRDLEVAASHTTLNWRQAAVSFMGARSRLATNLSSARP